MNPNQLAPDEHSALEQTTAPRTVSSVGLSAESIAERDAYLQLGQLLERAAGEFDEQAFLRKLQSGMKTPAPSVVVRPTVSPQRKGNELWIAISIAAAAVVVIGAGIWFSRGDMKVVKVPVEKENVPAVAQKQTTPAPREVVQAPPQIVQTPTVPASSARDWTDPLDERIAEMREHIRDVAQPYLMDAPLQLISEQVRELQEELDAGTL